MNAYTMDDVDLEGDGVRSRYYETSAERVLSFERTSDGGAAAVTQNREGYGMLKVRPAPEQPELERYYGFEMALDHAAEILGKTPAELPIPDAAADMGM